MIKVYALLPRRRDISVELFHRHWRTVHREHALRIRRLRGYVQSHRIEGGVPGLHPAPYEGIPEVWYESLASALGQRLDPDYVEHAKRDEPNFVDVAGLRRVMTHQRAVAGTPPPGATKALLLVRAAAGIGPSFEPRWWELADRLPDLCPTAAAVSAAAALPASSGALGGPYDAVAELWWRDASTFRKSWAVSRAALIGQLGAVADLRRSHGFLCEELRVLWPPRGGWAKGAPRPARLRPPSADPA